MSLKSVIKVILLDDEQRALNRLKLLLKNFQEIEILDQFQDPDLAISEIVKCNPDLVFLDIEMPNTSGLEVAEELNKHFLDSKYVFITSHEHYAMKAIKNNAFDYLLKPVAIDELKKTIDRFKIKHLSNLTKREFEIISLIAKGLNSQQIGEKLFLSRHTIDTHRRMILDKTSCKNSAELIGYAIKSNII